MRIAHSLLSLLIIYIFMCPLAKGRAEHKLMSLILEDLLWWEIRYLALRRLIHHTFQRFRLQSTREGTFLIHHEAFVLR